MKNHPAEIIRTYGPFPGVAAVHGVTFDGENVWFASGDRLNAINPGSGEVVRALAVPAHAGTAFDGRHLFQIAEDYIQKLDPKTGEVLAKIPAPGGGADSGLAWADGVLWVGQNRARKIHQIDPDTGEILRTLETKGYVTGVSWVDGELWHGVAQDETRFIRRLDPQSGRAIEELQLPEGARMTGLESDGGDHFFCGGGDTGKIAVVKRPKP